MKTRSFNLLLVLGAMAILIGSEIVHAQSSPPCNGVPITATDLDCDGIPDQLEHELLAMFTPFFRYSRDNGNNETFRPADVRSYLSTAQIDASGKEGKNIVIARNKLANDPNQLLYIGSGASSSNLLINPARSNYHVNPDNDSGRRGVPWPQALASKRVGLYGHVVPIRLQSAEQYDRNLVPSPVDKGTIFYKIEYWQFFGYSSNDKPLDVGDHEGDWDTIQLLYQPANPTLHQAGALKSVLFYAHGKEMRFDLSSKVGEPVLMENGTVIEIRGNQYNEPVPNLHDSGAEAKARNHILRLFKDPTTGQFTHPVVFVEHGGHEFWPSPHWDFIGAQKHGGDDIKDSYLAATPPNLGEVDHPLNEDPMAAIILQFNGYWGTYSRALPGIFKNNPPPGPPMHFEWTYPINQLIRPPVSSLEY